MTARAVQLSLFDGVERVRVGGYEGTVVRELSPPKVGYHGRLVIVKFDGPDEEPRSIDAPLCFAGCQLICDMGPVTWEEPRELATLRTKRAERAVALSGGAT